jgi:hypothetical protein
LKAEGNEVMKTIDPDQPIQEQELKDARYNTTILTK